MHYILGALAIAAGVIIWILRVRAATHAVRDVVDLTDDVRAAARRLGYRSSKGHPSDNVADARLLASGIMSNLARLDGDPTHEAHVAIASECRATFQCSESEAADIAAFGRWLASHNASPHEGLRRLTRRLIKVTDFKDRGRLAADLERMMTAVGKAQDGDAISSSKLHGIRQTRAMLEGR